MANEKPRKKFDYRPSRRIELLAMFRRARNGNAADFLRYLQDHIDRDVPLPIADLEMLHLAFSPQKRGRRGGAAYDDNQSYRRKQIIRRTRQRKKRWLVDNGRKRVPREVSQRIIQEEIDAETIKDPTLTMTVEEVEREMQHRSASVKD